MKIPLALRPAGKLVPVNPEAGVSMRATRKVAKVSGGVKLAYPSRWKQTLKSSGSNEASQGHR